MSFSKSEELEPQQSTPPNNATAPYTFRTNKKIKKRRKVKSNVQPANHTHPQPLIQGFLSHRAQGYFSLSALEAKQACNGAFRSFVHIKNIISQQQNVYNLKNYIQAPSHADKYLALCRLARRNRLHSLRFSTKYHRKTVRCYLYKQEGGSKREVVLLDEDEARLISKRSEILEEVDRFLGDVFKDKPEAVVDPIAKEIITLCKLNNIYQRQVTSDMERYIQVQPDTLYQAHSQQIDRSNQLQNLYCQLVIRKNLMAAFDETPLDFLNYFKKIDIKEQSIEDHDPLQLLASAQQFKKYLKLMKPNPNKTEKDQLKTACGACFSDCNQTYNPLVRCPQCGIRLHRLCHNLRGKCEKCKYTRKTIEEKSNKPYCFICLREKEHGVSIQTIKSGQQEHYAHTFCLLISKFWSIQGSQLIYKKGQLSQYEQCCSICQKRGGLCLKTEEQQYFHGLCAYLQGYSMAISSSDTIVLRRSSEAERIALQRHFKINFQKAIYRRTDQILDNIQKQ